MESKKTFNVIIAGGRDFNDYELLKSKCFSLLKNKMDECDVHIVCGCARGADTLGRQFAEEFRLKVLEYPADWDRYGKKAGYLRNEEMAKVGNALIAFWDGKSRGTGHMIDLAKKYKLVIRIIYYDILPSLK